MTIADPFRSPTGLIPRVRTSYTNGFSPGAPYVIPGISFNEDRLLSVIAITFTLAEGVPNTISNWFVADLTAEFSITGDGFISNPGGTSALGDLVVVVWEDHDFGEQTEVGWQE